MKESELRTGARYIGTIESVDDRSHEGAVRVRVSPFMDGIIKTSDLPIAKQAIHGGGAFRIPRIGEQYYVRFENGPDIQPDIARPILEGPVRISNENVKEHEPDYEPGLVNLAYDHESGLRIGYSSNTGIISYLKGSYFSIQSDGTINFIHSGNTSAISLENDNINAIAKNDITFNALNSVSLECETLNLIGTKGTYIKGDTPGECAVNGNILKEMLLELASLIDSKYPVTANIATSYVKSMIPALLNEQIKYV